MVRFTLEQRWEILKTYFQSDCCVAETVRLLKKSFGRNGAPSAPAVRKFVQKVRETGMLVDNTQGPRRRTVRTDEIVNAVAECVGLNPGISTRVLSRQLNIPRTSLRRILHQDLGLTGYVGHEQKADVEKKQKVRPKKRAAEVVETPSEEEVVVISIDDDETTTPVKHSREQSPKSGALAIKIKPPKKSLNKKKKKPSEDKKCVDEESEVEIC